MDIVSFEKIFIDKQSFDQYYNFVNCKEHISFSTKAPGYDRHHIIPRAAFDAEVDDSEINVVKLTVFEHLQAHLLLAKGLKNSELKNKMCYCLSVMTGYKYNQCSESILIEAADLIKKGRQYHSQRLKNYYKNLSAEDRYNKYCGEHWKETHKNNNSPEQIARHNSKVAQHIEQQRKQIAKKQHETKLKNNSYAIAAQKCKETMKAKGYDLSAMRKEAAKHRSYEAAHAGAVAAIKKYNSMTEEEKQELNNKKRKGGQLSWQKRRENPELYNQYCDRLRQTKIANKDYPDIVCDQFPGEIFKLYADLAKRIGNGCNSSHIKRVCLENKFNKDNPCSYKGYVCYFTN